MIDLTRATLSQLDADERPGMLKLALRRELARVLRVEPGQVDAAVPVTALGLDSLGAVELAHAVEEGLGVSLPLDELLEGPSVGELARRLSERLAEAPAAEPPATPDEASPAPTTWRSPLTDGQRALVFLERLATGESAYHVAAAARVLSPLDPDVLGRAVDALADRHPLLRAAVQEGEGGPMLDVAAGRRPGLTVLERPDASDEVLVELLAGEARRPFDLAAGPLCRLTLVRRVERPPVLLLVLHHVVCDFRSVAVLVRDLAVLYRYEAGGGPAELPPLPRSYGEWATAQRRRLAGPEGAALARWWREQLEPLPEVAPLPVDQPRTLRATGRAGIRLRRLVAPTAEAVAALARSRGVTPFVVLLAAFEAWLVRWTGRPEVLIGTPALNRQEAATAEIVGYFVNLLALPARLRGDQPFGDFLGVTGRQVQAALQHQEYPFARLAESVAPGRDPGTEPLVSTAFQLQQARPEGLAAFALGLAGARVEVAGWRLESLALPEPRTPFDLVLRTALLDGRVVASLLYDLDLFDATTIERALASFEVLLAAAVAAPDAPLAELPVLGAAGRHQLLVEWNDRAAPPAPAAPLETVLETVLDGPCLHAPERVAVVCGDGHLTYGELACRASRLAGGLLAAGLRAGEVVGVVTPPSLDWVVALLGVQVAGCAYLPLDPDVPRERSLSMLADADVRVAVTGAGAPLGESGAVRFATVAELTGGAGTENAVPERPSPDRLAYVIYTSGSTGRPKGVEVVHDSLAHFVVWQVEACALTAADAASQLAGLSFDASILELWPVLASGARLEIGDGAVRRSPLDLPGWLAERAVTVAFLPTPLAEVVIDGEWPRSCALRILLTGGDALRKRPRPGLPFTLMNDYGPTETTVVATAGPVMPGEDPRPPSLGRPLPGVAIYLLDRDDGLAPWGSAGELTVGGAGVARGYRGRPVSTAAAFVPDPFSGEVGARLYRTGDLARWLPTGELAFLGRADRQVQVRGFRVEPGEIEAALLAAGAAAAVVVPRPGPAGVRLVAYVVADGDDAEVPARLRQALAGRLPTYMVPAAIVLLPALPQTPAGKVDRRYLTENGPEPPRPQLATPYRPPSTPLEEAIAGQWRRVLAVERVGVEDNFFELGGHSLLLPELQLALERELGRSVPLVRLLENPTVSTLARVLSGDAAEARGARREESRSRAEKLRRRLGRR